MKPIPVMLALLAIGWGATHAVPGSTNSAAPNRILLIDPSSMPVAAGNATLTIGPLLRADGVYTGNYKINVSPYFFKNEKGRLAIVVSDESLAGIAQGKVAVIIGTATTSGPGGVSRHVDATATPANINRGTLKLWFTAGDRKMIFEPAYHFTGNGTAAVVVKTTETNTAFNLQRRLPASHLASLEAASLHP
jgi:hypothetical protein